MCFSLIQSQIGYSLKPRLQTPQVFYLFHLSEQVFLKTFSLVPMLVCPPCLGHSCYPGFAWEVFSSSAHVVVSLVFCICLTVSGLERWNVPSSNFRRKNTWEICFWDFASWVQWLVIQHEFQMSFRVWKAKNHIFETSIQWGSKSPVICTNKIHLHKFQIY